MKVIMRVKPQMLLRSRHLWASALILGLLVAGLIIGQTSYSGGQNVVVTSGNLTGSQAINENQVGGNAIDVNSGTKSNGTQRIVIATDQPQLTNAWKVDGTGGSFPVTGTVGLGTGNLLIGTVLPKTGCGTTVYDSSPTNLPASITVVTATATCVYSLSCKSLDAAAAHPLTFTDGSAACNSGTCNLIPPGFLIAALADAHFFFDYVKAVGGVKWNTDAINKLTCWVEGIQ